MLFLLAASAALPGCSVAVFDPQGPVGKAEKIILLDALGIMLAIVVPTIIATLAVAWWFRASNRRARYLPGWSYSGRIELVVWSIPLLVIIFLGGLSWIASHDLDPGTSLKSTRKPLEVQVVALDWKWLFIYPQQRIASVNRLVIPVGVPVHFSLTSASVMNTFFVPQLGSMIATMNGMSTVLSLQADHPGTYYGESAQFSGDGFADMHFAVLAMSANSFDDWIRTVRASASALDDRAYDQLLQQTMKVQPFTYGAVDPGLYDRIFDQKLPPGAGPVQGRPSPDVSPRPGD